MTNRASVRVVLRAAAIAIAVAALVDPAFSWPRRDRAVVAVTTGDVSGAGDGVYAIDAALAARVRTRLSRDFLVVPGSYLGADAVVSVGAGLPPQASAFHVPAFAVTAAPLDPTLDVERVDVPVGVPAGAIARVRIAVRARLGRGRRVTVSLFAHGVLVDEASRAVTDEDQLIESTLGAPTPDSGVMSLRVTAILDGVSGATRTSAVADAATQVSDHKWNVLFVDIRPSWMSTFVRRAIERDGRFDAASRVEASTGVVSATGSAPRLTDTAARDRFDEIVVGAAEALSADDVRALDAFMRLRGGSVVLLFDEAARGPATRLTGAATWRTRAGAARSLGTTVDSGAPLLRAAELTWPVTLPPGATPMVLASVSPPSPSPFPSPSPGTQPLSGPDSPSPAVIWSSAVGAGHLVVSGALDAWRYRDASESRFDEFWRDVVAAEAARAWPQVAVTVTPSVARPGEAVTVAAELRAAALDAVAHGAAEAFSASASVSATLGGVPLRLLPDASTGRLVAFARAPSHGAPDGAGANAPRTVIATVRAGTVEAHAPLIVADSVTRPSGGRDDVLTAWVQSHGGRVVPEAELASLPAALIAAVRPAVRDEPWHPFRSAWWIVPFALLLSAEWYLRRRGSLA